MKRSPTNSEINDFDDKNYLSNSQSVYHSEMSKLLHISNYPSHNNNKLNLSTSSITYSLFDNNTPIYENSEKKLNSLLKVRQINQQTKVLHMDLCIEVLIISNLRIQQRHYRTTIYCVKILFIQMLAQQLFGMLKISE